MVIRDIDVCVLFLTRNISIYDSKKCNVLAVPLNSLNTTANSSFTDLNILLR